MTAYTGDESIVMKPGGPLGLAAAATAGGLGLTCLSGDFTEPCPAAAPAGCAAADLAPLALTSLPGPLPDPCPAAAPAGCADADPDGCGVSPDGGADVAAAT